MLEEIQIVNYWIVSKDVNFLDRVGLDKSYFFVLNDVVQFIEDFSKEHGQLPSQELVATEFEDFRKMDNLDSVEYLANVLKEQKVYTEYRPVLTSNAQLVNEGKTMEALLKMRADIDELLNKHNKSTYKPTPILVYLNDGFLRDIKIKRESTRIETGFHDLDRALGGGLYSGLYTLGAIPSLGKTAMAVQIADNLASQGNHVMFFTLEMSIGELLARSLTREIYQKQGQSTYNIGQVMNGSVPDEIISTGIEAYKAYSENLFFIEGNFDVDINMIKKTVNQHVIATGKKPIVFIDYLQVIKPLDNRMSERQSIDTTVVGLKRLSREIDIPVIVISSFNRASYDKVSFESFKESGCIEYTADVVMGLSLPKIDGMSIDELKCLPERPIELVILKNRLGRAFSKISYTYKPAVNHFSENTKGDFGF